MRSKSRLAAIAVAGVLLSCSDAVGPDLSEPASLTPEAATLALTYLGETAGVEVAVRDGTGAVISGAEPSWSTTDADVATVSEDGVVTAAGNGRTTIRATLGGLSASVEVTVRQLAAEATPSESTWTFAALADSLRLDVSVVDAGGSPIAEPVVAWSSLDSSVVVVSSSGLVTARSNGTTVVTATVDGVVASTAVSVEQTPSEMTVGADSVRFSALTDTLTLLPEVSDGGGSSVPDADVTWVTSDPAVVEVSVEGRLTAVSNGRTTVTATAGLVQRSVVVVVEQVVAALGLAPDSVVLRDPGDAASVSAMARDALGHPVSNVELAWETGDAGVVTVALDGTVTGVGTGATWVAASVAGVADTVAARVEPELVLLVSGDSTPSGQVDAEVSIAARVEDVLGASYPGATVRWSTDPGSGAIVSADEADSDQTGHVGAVWRLGTASGTQRAHASLETRGSTVTVTYAATAEAGPAVTAALTADSVLLSARGETAFLAPTYADAFGNPTAGSGVTWSSADPTVATVAVDGLVTGMAEGTTWLTATLQTPVDSVLVTVRHRGAVTITFDDGWRSVYDNAWPVLRSMDLPANVAVYTEAVGWPAYMTEAHLDELHEAGWAMVAHTVTHDSLPTLTAGELDFELRAGQQWLVDRGFRGSNVFVAPYHEFEDREKVAAAGYYTAARGTSAHTFSPDSLVSWMPDRPFDLTGMEAVDLPYTTVQGRDRLRALLQRTIDEGAFVDLFFHQIPAADVADFQALMDVVAEFRERVLPYDRLYPVWARTVN